MKRAVITGLGIVSCIGNNQETIINNLKNLNSGISSAPEYKEFSFRSLVHGKPNINLEKLQNPPPPPGAPHHDATRIHRGPDVVVAAEMQSASNHADAGLVYVLV